MRGRSQEALQRADKDRDTAPETLLSAANAQEALKCAVEQKDKIIQTLKKQVDNATTQTIAGK